MEEKWGQRENREPGMAARATYAPTKDVVRQTAPAGQAEKKRQRQVKNKRKKVNKRAKKIIKEREEKAEEDFWAEQSNAVVETGAVLVAMEWRTRRMKTQVVQVMRALQQEAADSVVEVSV